MQVQRRRIPHVLTTPKQNQQPSNLLFFDTETRSYKQHGNYKIERLKFWFGWLYAFRYEKGERTRSITKKFTTQDEFWEIVKSRLDKKRPLYIFAHNLGFDLTITDFWHWSELNKITIEYFVINDPPTFIFCNYNGKRMVFVDTFNYWIQSLAALGKSVGLEKYEMPEYSKGIKEWDKYAFRDVEIIAKAVTDLMDYLKEYNLGHFGLSLAGISYNTYRHRFMKHKIYIHDDIATCMLERECYYGGLVQCFYVGKLSKQKIYKLDVNSLYPFCMLNKFPTKLVQRDKYPPIKKVRETLERYGGCARVEIQDYNKAYPKRYNDKLCYVVGRYETYLCGDELKDALASGSVKSVPTIAYYEMEYLFTDFVKFFWEERKRHKANGDDVKQYFTKILLNSLYGKFGQRGFDYVDLTPEVLRDIYEQAKVAFPKRYSETAGLHIPREMESVWFPSGLKQPIRLRQFNDKILVKVPCGEHSESFPAISAFVTAYARQFLLSLVRIAGKNNVFYTDTDSLFVNQIGLDNLSYMNYINPHELGKLKIEETTNEVCIFGPKEYTFGDKETRKGIRRDAIEVSEGVFIQKQFEHIKSVIKRGYESFIDIKYITKRNTRRYNKGIVGLDGWVKPFTLPDNEEYLKATEI